MALETYLSNIIIKNNVIKPGVGYHYTGLGFIPNSSSHVRQAFITGSATIENNIFHALTTGADMLSLTNGSCIISGNKFISDGYGAITSFIRQYGTGDHIITNNMFDHLTSDNPSYAFYLPVIPCTNLSENTIFNKNINQLVYIPVPLMNSESNVMPETGKYVTDGYGLQKPLDGYRPYTYIETPISTTVKPTFFINLNGVLPEGIKVVEARMGIYAPNGMTSLNAGTITMKLVSHAGEYINYYNSGNSGILDAKNRAYTHNVLAETSYALASQYSAIQSNTGYIGLDPFTSGPLTGQDAFRVGHNSLSIQVAFDYTTSGAGTVAFIVSPIVFKCVW